MRISDWSSDVCSSDLVTQVASRPPARPPSTGEVKPPCSKPATKPTKVSTRISGPGVVSARPRPDRKSVVSGKSVSVRVDLGGRRIIKKKRYTKRITMNSVGKNYKKLCDHTICHQQIKTK